MITHLEPDILECEVKWALGSITTNKASGGDGIPAELFQILKDDAVKVLHSICQQIWKTQQWPQDWKRSVFIPIPEKGNAKECSNYCTIPLISHVSKVMLKILQARLQQYVNHELPDVQAGFRKGSPDHQFFQLDGQLALGLPAMLTWEYLPPHCCVGSLACESHCLDPLPLLVKGIFQYLPKKRYKVVNFLRCQISEISLVFHHRQ